MHRFRYDQYAGVEIVIEEIPGTEKITLASAADRVQKIQDIGKPGQYSARLNAGFFCDQRSSTLYGEAYGVRCGADEWNVPRQGKFIYYAIMNDGRTEVGMDTDFWYTRAQCRCAGLQALTASTVSTTMAITPLTPLPAYTTLSLVSAYK